MGQVVGTLAVNDNPYNRAEIVKKTDQNQLSGIAWHTAGTTLSFGALASTAGVVAFLGQSALTLAGVIDSGYLYVPSSMIEFGVAVGALALVDIAFVKGVAECFTNAMYHLGPDTEIRYQPPQSNFPAQYEVKAMPQPPAYSSAYQY